MGSKQTPGQGAIVLSATPLRHKYDNAKDNAVVLPASASNAPADRDRGLISHSLKPVGFFQLFRFADSCDLVLLFVGIAGAALSGACWPGFSIAFGEVLNAFFKPDPGAEVKMWVLIMLYIAFGSFVGGVLEVWCTKLAGSRITSRVKENYVKSLLNQDIMFFDVQSAHGHLMKGLNHDVTAFQESISERCGAFAHNLAVFVFGIAVAFWRGWKLTLVVFSSIPCLVFVSAIIAIFTGKLNARAVSAYAKAGAIAQEALLNHRTVSAFCAEEAAVKKYESCLELPVKWGKQQGFLSGLTLGATHFVFFGAYALSLWVGSLWVADGDYTGGEVINVILSAVLAGFALGQAMPHIEYFQRGRQAAAELYALIARRPNVDVDADGTILPTIKGDIEFQAITFAYPAAPTRLVLDKCSLTIPAGSSMAVVGQSGSGKSTVVQLIQRFYDPIAGFVSIDGHDLRTLQLRWLRSQIGFVSQEPVLFDASIFSNIAHGKPGATREEVMQAAMLANANSWIAKLPAGYDTRVGEKGIQLSGGQKQRIAIARAILRNPKILLLDEATSSLDVQSEKVVQAALSGLMVGRTTIIVAHRLSTVVDCDCISVLNKGQVTETGTHAELSNQSGGVYAAMWALQQTKAWEQGDYQDDESTNTRGSKKQVAAVPEAVLKRGSVRLSIIPASIQAKLAGRKEAAASNAAGPKQPSTFRKLLTLNRPEWKFGSLGLLCSAVLGLAMPFYALALGSILSDYYNPDPEEVKAGGRKWGAVFTGIGVACLFLEPVQGWCFAVMGQHLAKRVRISTFKAMLYQEGGWFDAEDNSSAALSARLANDASSVRGAVGDRVGLLVQNLSCAIAAYIIAFVSSWSVTLVVTAALPFLAIAQVIQAKVYFGASNSDAGATDAANRVAGEALSAVRTVTAYSLQGEIAKLYTSAAGAKTPGKTAFWAGVGFGFSQFALYGIFCIAFIFGYSEIEGGRINFEDLLRAFLAVFYCAFGIAQAQAAFPDIAVAAGATKRIFDVLERKPAIDANQKIGVQLPMLTGAIKFEDVTFAYPTRPGRLVLKQFNLTVAPDTSLAVVGESGMGKSTVIGLLERLYDPVDGAVLLDGVDIGKLNLKWLRSQIGLVNQEPVLFNGTILYNIRYGKETATEEEVLAAAKVANAVEFIERMPEKLNTRLGEGGIQLSGGQKQRIAIARAVLKDPRILLLDEATSALDAESERLVQTALDSIMVGRTTLIVAHRLSTIRTADRIAVVYRGRVLEEGNHEELAKAQGYYSHMIATAAASGR